MKNPIYKPSGKAAEEIDNTTKWQCSECLLAVDSEKVRSCILDFGRKIEDGEEGPVTCPYSGTDCSWREVTDNRSV